MEEKKAKKISVSTIFLMILVAIIIVLGVFLFKVYRDKQVQVKDNDTLEMKISSLSTEKEELQNKIDKIINTINSNSSNDTNNTTATNQSEKSTNQPTQMDLDSYLGRWYESEDHSSNNNPNDLIVKNTSSNKLVMDLYLTRTANFDNFEATINGNTGTFEATTDNGPSKNGGASKIEGKIELLANEIKLTITKSNVLYLDDGVEYIFKYQIKNSSIDSYKGTWYENQQQSNERNANTLEIVNVDKNKMTFKLYITRTAEFANVTTYVTNNVGNFEATTDNGPTQDGSESKITGYVELNGDSIKVVVGQSNVMYLDAGTEYTFGYKSN